MHDDCRDQFADGRELGRTGLPIGPGGEVEMMTEAETPAVVAQAIRDALRKAGVAASGADVTERSKGSSSAWYEA